MVIENRGGIKPLWDFIVDAPQTVKETIDVGGKELFVDTRFNPFAHRMTEATVIATPVKRTLHSVKAGDKVWLFHHAMLEPELKFDDSGLRRARFNPENETADIIAYKGSDGVLKPLYTWVICHIEQKKGEEKTDAGIFLDKSKEKPDSAIVAFDSPYLEEMGIKAGDRVHFIKFSDYEVEIDGTKYWCMRTHQLTYLP
jgi:co-chaperonin GroES (HSP10)